MSGFADGWARGRPETQCGDGSLIANTAAIRNALPQWIEKYGIESLADVGAGDMNWISQVNLRIKYIPYDLVVWHSQIVQWDILEKPLPPSDAVLCRYVLNHFSESKALSALSNIWQSCKMLIATTHDGPRNEIIADGHFCDYDLRKAPFNLGEPLESVKDHRGLLCLWLVS